MLHSGRPALLTIDVQRDVFDPAGTLFVPGTAELLPAMGAVASAFRRTGWPIVHVVRLYLADGSNAEPVRRDLAQAGSVLRPGSAGSQLARELLPHGAADLEPELLLAGGLQQVGELEWVMYKPRWGAFYGTPLERQLVEHAVDTVTLVGCNFPNCPRTTLYEASERDLGIVLVADAVSGTYDRGLAELAGIGARVLTAADVVSEAEPMATADP